MQSARSHHVLARKSIDLAADGHQCSHQSDSNERHGVPSLLAHLFRRALHDIRRYNMDVDNTGIRMAQIAFP